jgi:hypothetical protein
LGASESALAKVARQLHARVDPLDLGSGMSVAKLLAALFSLECRSPYSLARMQKALLRDPNLRDQLGAAPTETAKQIALQNMPNYTHELSLQVTPPGFSIVHSAGGGVIICDRPYFNDSSMEQRFFALTNKVILSVERIESQVLYRYIDAKPDFLHSINEQMALQARSWIAAESEDVLDRYIAIVESPDWRRRRDSESVVVEPFEYLVSGWGFRSPSPEDDESE